MIIGIRSPKRWMIPLIIANCFSSGLSDRGTYSMSHLRILSTMTLSTHWKPLRAFLKGSMGIESQHEYGH
jgi:hypothetical protein